ncbi:MAG: hypothetical protein ACXVYB_00305 [Arthrobacter sp.]
MARYEFPSMVAKDPLLDVTVRNALGHIYAPGDTTFSTPLTAYDRYGMTKATIHCTAEGQTEEFYVDDEPIVWWYSGGYAFLVSSFTGMLAACQMAQSAAQNAQLAAEAAKRAADAAVGGAVGAGDSGVAALINNESSATRAALDAIFTAVGMKAHTVDTNQPYKAILLSDGTVKAVPESTVAPAAPTGVAGAAGPTSARLTWNASDGASFYTVYRNLNQIGTTTGRVFLDVGPTGSRFSYVVTATNSYGMRSALSSAVSVYMDPALNVPPEVDITTWPATIPTTGSCIVRVNSTDVNVQTLAMSLSTGTGSLQPTRDPSVWILTL